MTDTSLGSRLAFAQAAAIRSLSSSIFSASGDRLATSWAPSRADQIGSNFQPRIIRKRDVTPTRADGFSAETQSSRRRKEIEPRSREVAKSHSQIGQSRSRSDPVWKEDERDCWLTLRGFVVQLLLLTVLATAIRRLPEWHRWRFREHLAPTISCVKCYGCNPC